MTKDELLKHVTTLDFIAIDIALYCDTHPHDKEAAKAYKEVTKAATDVRREYERAHGSLTHFGSVRDDKWCWNDNPWPWQKDANYCLADHHHHHHKEHAKLEAAIEGVLAEKGITESKGEVTINVDL